MKSIKPGRGPSMLGGIVGIFMVGAGIVWTVSASEAGGAFALFGVFWTACAASVAIYNLKNATKKNRYSAFDITEGEEEPDPLNEHFSDEAEKMAETENSGAFCPYCGTPVEEDFLYCHSCGKKLP